MLHFTSILHTHLSVFVVCPTDGTSVAQGLIFGGFRGRAHCAVMPGVHDNALGPVGISLKKASQVPSYKHSSSKEG